MPANVKVVTFKKFNFILSPLKYYFKFASMIERYFDVSNIKLTALVSNIEMILVDMGAVISTAFLKDKKSLNTQQCLTVQ